MYFSRKGGYVCARYTCSRWYSNARRGTKRRLVEQTEREREREKKGIVHRDSGMELYNMQYRSQLFQDVNKH